MRLSGSISLGIGGVKRVELVSGIGTIGLSVGGTFCVSCPLKVPSGDVASCNGAALVDSEGGITELPTEPFWHEAQPEPTVPKLPPVAKPPVPHVDPHADPHGFE